MLDQEVDEFLQRMRYERGREFRGYRNGHAPERRIGTGLGQVSVRMPRVRDVPPDVAPPVYTGAMSPRSSGATNALRRARNAC
jgi:hypothetical protein